MPNIKHAFTSTAPEGGDSSKVRTSNWNAEHTLDQYLEYPVQTSAPSAPTSGLRVFSKSTAGRTLLELIGPSGVDIALQPALFGNTVTMYIPAGGQLLNTVAAASATNVMSSTTMPTSGFGTAWVVQSVGTATATLGLTNPVITNTSAYTRLRRTLLATGTNATSGTSIFSGLGGGAVGTLNSLVSLPATGFFMSMRFAVDTYLSSLQMFLGLAAATTVTSDPSGWAGSLCGIGKDSGDSTWQIMTRNGTTTTKTATGVTPTAGQILDFSAFMAPNGSSITYRLVDVATGTVSVDNVTVSATQPTGPLAARFHIRSTAGTTSKLLAINKFYLETDY